MKTTLLSILIKKESIHWKRMNVLIQRVNGWFSKYVLGLIAIIIITLFHYAFALMHTMYEIFLFVFANKQFKKNLQSLNDKL